MYIYIYIYIYTYIYMDTHACTVFDAIFVYYTGWPLHDIAITNIVWHVMQYRMVRGKLYCAIV